MERNINSHCPRKPQHLSNSPELNPRSDEAGFPPGPKGSSCGIVGAGAAGRTDGRTRGTSASVGWRSRATMSVSMATWLVRADSVEEAEVVEVLSSPISPVTWENANESSELSLVSCAE